MRTQNPETVRLIPRAKAETSGDKDVSVSRGLGLFGLAAGAMLLVAAVTSTTARAVLGVSSVSAAELNDGAMRTLGRLGSGVSPVTFTVHLCGVPDDVWNRHVPWPVCRVKLVGCPSTGNCWHWRYH